MTNSGNDKDRAPVQTRKLIEVALPLEAINRESAREKSIRHGHPSTLHLRWARRPLAAARAVLFAQLVDDPSSHPDRFPTEEAQKAERERLHKLIERLIVWENIRDGKLLAEAHQEILNSTDGNPPPILDPFCGGGTIPLEAQRLGLEANASDLNPVAVLITKALIEIPPKFHDQPPVFPGLAETRLEWKSAEGLAVDVRAYGQWMRDEAEKRIGHLYPKAKLPDGSDATVIAWIWARTVACPNPACRIEMPLVRSWWLGKKEGKKAYVVPDVVADPSHPSGKRVEFSVGHDKDEAPGDGEGGTVTRLGAVCVACEMPAPLAYVRAEGKAHRIGSALMAIVGEGQRRRIYLPPDLHHASAANVKRPVDVPPGALGHDPRAITAPNYGFTEWAHLFTNRQLLALTTFSDLVSEVRDRVVDDAQSAGLSKGGRLEAGGTETADYADAVVTYLGLAVSKAAEMNNRLVSWKPSMDQAIGLFRRQAIPMTWDYAETPPLSAKHAGGVLTSLMGMLRVFDGLPNGVLASTRQADAASAITDGALISTDPPYYDNIGYSDLSDFFYVWLRRTLRHVHPALMATLLVPKTEELVANPYRQGSTAKAKEFFEHGFKSFFERTREFAGSSFPIAVFYAFKQSESSLDGTTSSGWETLLEGMVRSGWRITATWPMRSELGNRMRSQGSNALASSIVLALRPRPETAKTTDRRDFIAALQAELPQALRNLQQGTIAPVDLPQAAIGPGMAVFSRYSSVIESDGSPMPVRSALARINEILDQVLNEQEGDFDATTRFAIAWYRQHGYGTGKFGDADNLARARNTAVETLDRDEILTSRAGKVALIKPADLPEDYDVLRDLHTSIWESLHYLIKILESQGIGPAGEFVAAATSRKDGAVRADLIKELAFLMFSIAEKNGWTKDALSFNTLATSWSEIIDASRSASPSISQTVFDFVVEE
jgi:putative DNA methylase